MEFPTATISHFFLLIFYFFLFISSFFCEIFFAYILYLQLVRYIWKFSFIKVIHTKVSHDMD